MVRRNARRLIFLVMTIATPSFVLGADDPVDAFIATADSLARVGDDAFVRYLGENSILVGAAVNAVLDAAFAASLAGDAAGESENVAFAERIAKLYESHGGSPTPLALVEEYSRWTKAQRETKVRAQQLEKQSNEARDRRELDEAAALLEEARALYEEIGDRRGVAVTYGSLGVVHWYRNDMAAVRSSYDRALEARRAIEDAILEGRTLNGLGSTCLRTGDYAGAVAFYREAIALRRRTGDHSGLGTSLTYLGNCYFQMNQLIDARRCFEEALPIVERVGAPAQMIEILNSVANLNTDMGRLRAANDAYRRAIDIAVAAGSAVDEATCRINLADNLQRATKYTEAIEELDAAAARLEASPEPYRLADLQRTRAQVYLSMDELDRARDVLAEFRRQAATLDEPYYRIDAQVMTAQMYMALDAYDKGIAAAEEAIASAREHKVVRAERQAEVIAARLEARAGRPDAALAHWQNAYAIDERDGAVSQMIEARLGIAGVLALRGDHAEARARFRELMPLAREAGLLDYMSVAHLGIAHSYERDDPDSAAVHYAAALDSYERSLRDLGGAEASAGFLAGERRFVYEEVARYYASQYARGALEEWSERAFRTVESAKARGLLDLLRSAQAYETTQAEEALLDSLYTLRARKNADSSQLEKVEKQYHALRNARVSRSVGALETTDPIVSPSDVSPRLQKGTVLLSYALGDTASLVWAIDREGSELHTLANRSELERQVAQLRDAIARPGAGDETLRRAARSLYTALLAPLEPALEGAKRVVVVPDGVLFELPFELLLADEPKAGTGWKDLAYFARRFSVLYAPSASIFVALGAKGDEKAAPRYDLDLLALGDPAYTAASGLERLPYTREEVAGIGARVADDRKQVFVGAAASEGALRSSLKQHHPRIVHLAAHGLVDPHDPSASSVALCADSAGTTDGYLHTLEIISLPLDVGLVVVSACESARGRLSRSEGVVGLSRAFVASGARSVVASLWSVSDRSTAVLMEEFYKRMMGKKEPAAEALAGARLALLDNPDTAHPFHWSPFIAIGMESAPW